MMKTVYRIIILISVLGGMALGADLPDPSFQTSYAKIGDMRLAAQLTTNHVSCIVSYPEGVTVRFAMSIKNGVNSFTVNIGNGADDERGALTCMVPINDGSTRLIRVASNDSIEVVRIDAAGPEFASELYNSLNGKGHPKRMADILKRHRMLKHLR